jgi:hypothetical protein
LEAVEVSHETLTRLLADTTTETALVSGAMCLYRVLPILRWDVSSEPSETVAGLGEWDPENLPGRLRGLLEGLRDNLDDERFADNPEKIGELHSMASEMVLRFLEGNGEEEAAEWSDWCSTLSLDIHQQLDELLDESNERSAAVFIPAGTAPELTHLESLELSDQIRTLLGLASFDPAAQGNVLAIAESGNRRTREAIARLTSSM